MARRGQPKLLIHAAGARWRWAVLGAADTESAQGYCDPQAPDWPDGLPVYIFCDAARCAGLTVDLPELSGHRLTQALRWAAEEHLAASAEDEHVVSAGRTPEGQVRCVVMADAELQSVLEPLQGQSVELLCPDALCLPWQDGEVSLAEGEGQILARWGDWQFGVFEPELVGDLLDGLADAQARWRWYDGNLPASLESRVEQQAGQHLISVLARCCSAPPVNLLTGRWAPRSAQAAHRRWQLVAGLGGLAVLLGLAGVGLEHRLLQSRSASLQDAIDQRFAEAFPGVTPAGRHRELAERELARLRFGESAGLLELLYRTAPVLSAQQGVSVQGLSYRDESLELRLRAPDVAGLDELERRLRALELAASVQSASLDGDGASGRIRIQENRR